METIKEIAKELVEVSEQLEKTENQLKMVKNSRVIEISMHFNNNGDRQYLTIPKGDKVLNNMIQYNLIIMLEKNIKSFKKRINDLNQKLTKLC